MRNLYNVNGRWKYRRVVPSHLRAHIDGGITEYVRWLGQGAALPSPDVLRKYAACAAECDRLLDLAQKRAVGRFDELDAEAIAHIIATARSELLEEDEEARFYADEDRLFEKLRGQLMDAAPSSVANPDDDRAWNRRQEYLEHTLPAWRHEYARGQVSDFVISEVLDRCAGHGLHVDKSSLGFRRLAKSYLALLIEVGEASAKRQEGEIVATPEAPKSKSSKQLRGTPEQSLTGLVVDWWKEAKAAGRSVSTYEAYERAARQLAAFLQHDDANAVSKSDVIRFKDHRLEQGANPKTVKDGDLAGLRAVFRWGVANGRMGENPADGVGEERTQL